MQNPFRAMAHFARRLAASRRGNVLILMAFSVIPLTLAGGIAVDYSRAARLQTKLNAAADAAALASVSQPMMLKTVDEANVAARNMFKAQIINLPGLIWNDNGLTIKINGGDTSVTTKRTTVVTYTAQSVNAFAGIIGMATVTIGGSSTATATAAPNIDFYLALDTSPSMALPTTQGGINLMDKVLKCAFACHSNKIEQYVAANTVGKLPTLILDNTNFAIVKGNFGTGTVNGNAITKIDANNAYVYTSATVTDTIDKTRKLADNKTLIQDVCKLSNSNKQNICVYNADGTFADSYWYALNQNLSLRVTAERGAIQDLMTLAQTYAEENNRVYRAALYTFDHANQLKTIVAQPAELSTVSAAVPSINVALVNDQAILGKNKTTTNGCPLTGCSTNPDNTYLFTSFKSILDKLSTVMPNPSGHGTDDPGDTPQAYLFMVTDGMSDEANSNNQRTRSAMLQAQIDQCNTIKSHGIKIAILYTEYTVASIQDDEHTQRDIATAAIPNIAPHLTQCASPGLMYTVSTDQSITDALQALFAKAVASARIVQ